MCRLLHIHHICVYLSLKSWSIYLTVWITGTRCTIFNATRTSERAGIDTAPVTIALRRFTTINTSFIPRKYSSHIPLLSCLGFFSLLILSTMEDKRGTKRSHSPSKEGSSLSSGGSTPPLTPSGSSLPPGSPSEISSHRPYSLVFE
jgi:hypothetical protein